MKRLTVKGFNFTKDYIKRDIDAWSIAQCLSKLQQYEDAEENGMLIHLPCKVGDTVWKIDWLIDRDKKSCKECLYYCNDGYGSCDYDGDGLPNCAKAYETHTRGRRI